MRVKVGLALLVLLLALLKLSRTEVQGSLESNPRHHSLQPRACHVITLFQPPKEPSDNLITVCTAFIAADKQWLTSLFGLVFH